MRASETESRRPAVAAGSLAVWLTVVALFSLLSLPLCAAVPLSSPVVVQGEQWALYDVSSIKGAPYCLPYANSGYSLEIRGTDPVSRRVMVNSRPADLESRDVFPPQPGVMPEDARAYCATSGSWPELAELSRRLTRGCRTQYQAVNRVLCWVSGAIDYRTGPGVPVRPLEVFRQGAGNCVGASELAVALLREAGIPARGVRGFLASGNEAAMSSGTFRARESSLGEEGLHRWIEIYYPGEGWIFSDPFRSVNFVGPRYLVFDLEAPPAADGEEDGNGPAPARFLRLRLELSDPESTFIRLLDRGGTIVRTDVLPFLKAREGMAVRRNEPVQYKPAFIGRVVRRDGVGTVLPDEVHLLPAGGSGGTALLVAAVRDGVFSFTSLEEGEYRLHFYSNGEFVGARRARVHFPPQRVGAVRIELE